MSFTYIAGDIGGTNSRIHLYSVHGKDDEELLASGVYKSQDFNSLSGVINKFLADEHIEEKPSSACFSVAGPVKDGSVNLTNLGWDLSEKEMEAELGIKRFVFLNDFAACGYGVSLLGDEDLYELTNNKVPSETGPKIIIGAGTGLGEANIFRKDDGEFMVIPGEGGHTDFSPKSKMEYDLLLFIKKKLNLSRVGVERVVSGPGLENIYWFFVHNDPNLENHEVSAKLLNSEQPGKIISKLAIDEEDVLCEKALKLFISNYGAETGNMALNVLPSGGVYIAGGIAPQIRDVIKEGFLDSFYNKGRMRNLLCKFPIYIITNLSVGILGARYMARQKISEFDSTIARRLSRTDIHSMANEAHLLSEEPKDLIVEPPPPVRWGASPHRAARRPRRHSFPSERPREGAAAHTLWMALGVGLSGLMLAAYAFGKRSRD